MVSGGDWSHLRPRLALSNPITGIINDSRKLIENPWSTSTRGDYRRRIAASIRSKVYTHVKLLLKLLLLSNSVVLISESKQDTGKPSERGSWCSSRATLKNKLALVWHANLKRNALVRRLAFLVVLVSSAQLALRSLLFSYALFERDRLLQKVRAKYDLRSPSNGQLERQADSICAINRDLLGNGEPVGGAIQLLKASELVETLNIQLAVTPGLGFFFYALVGLGPFTFFFPLLGYLCLVRHPRVDVFAFLLDPLGEQRRLSNQTERIIQQVLAAVVKDASVLAAGVGAEVKTLAESAIVYNSQFVGKLNELRRRRMIRPLICSDQWHQLMLKVTRLMVLALIALSSLAPLTAYLGYFVMEVEARAQLRAQLFSCPDLFAYSEQLFGLPSIANLTNRSNYIAHISEARLKNLDYATEAKLFVSWNLVRNYLEHALLVFLLSLWATLSTLLAVQTNMLQAFWLNQVNQQVSGCSRMLAHYREQLYCERCDTTISIRTRVSKLVSDKRRRPLDLLFERISIAFINHELCRRQRKAAYRIHVFLFGQGALYTGCTAFCCLLVAVNSVSALRGPILVTTLAIVSFMNVFLFSSTLLVRLNSHLMHKIHRLMALGASDAALSLSSPFDLWRRQLLSNRDVLEHSAITLLGVSMSQERLIAFNAYLFGVFILASRVSGATAAN